MLSLDNLLTYEFKKEVRSTFDKLSADNPTSKFLNSFVNALILSLFSFIDSLIFFNS